MSQKISAALAAAAALAFSPQGWAQCEITKVHSSDAASMDNFGFAVALSGDIAVVGALDDDAGAQSGAAYLYDHLGMAWNERLKLTASDAAAADLFGMAVAVDGDIAVIGAWGDDDAGEGSGSAYVFERAGSMWVETAKLTASDASAGAQFGVSVAVSGDTIVVGARGAGGIGFGYGAAYVFEREGGVWAESQKLNASSVSPGAFFGQSSAISGDAIVIGALLDDAGATDSGSAFVFERQDGSFVETRKLVAADASLSDQFGSVCAIDGDRIIIGASRDNVAGENSGSAYIFERQGGDWVQRTKLVPSDGAQDDQFGISVSISGDHALIGAHLDNNVGADAGSAYLFERQGASWVQVNKFMASDGAGADQFGSAVGISGDTMIVGAPDDDDGGSSSGSTYVFSNGAACGGPGMPFCFGTMCPCGNDDPMGGCVNSTGAGAQLSASGSTSISADDLSLFASGLPADNSGLFFAGDTALSARPFVGDGLGCVGGNAYRFMPGIVNSDGTFTLRNLSANAPAGFVVPGETLHFQAWTRDVLCGPPPAPCASPCGAGSNLSNAYSIVFTP